MSNRHILARANFGCMYTANHVDTHDTFNALWAASLLLSASEAFQYPTFKSAATNILDQMNEYIYQQNTRRMIVIDGNVRPIWDAMYARCLFKNGDTEQGVEYCRGISWLDTHRDHNGVLIATYLDAFHYSKDEIFLDWARKTRTIVLASERLSAFDAWGIALLGKTEPKDEDVDYLKRMLKTANVNPKNMIGIVAPIVLHTCSAYKYLTQDLSYETRYSQAFERQLQLQVTIEHSFGLNDFGAFVQSEKAPNTRLDYTISSSFALIYHLLPKISFCF